MKWPRGRYNGQRIVGVVVKVRIDVTRWRPYFSLRHGMCFVALGPLHAWIEAAYD